MVDTLCPIQKQDIDFSIMGEANPHYKMGEALTKN
jgi:hypothetical protein